MLPERPADSPHTGHSHIIYRGRVGEVLRGSPPPPTSEGRGGVVVERRRVVSPVVAAHAVVRGRGGGGRRQRTQIPAIGVLVLGCDDGGDAEGVGGGGVVLEVVVVLQVAAVVLQIAAVVLQVSVGVILQVGGGGVVLQEGRMEGRRGV